jgi:D-arabinose 1-dehydrogenase-like Zn-dependent alcohol dehydrogenase
LDAAGVAPLMCAGITVWEPMEQWKVGPGMSVGVVGLGGLGGGRPATRRMLEFCAEHGITADVEVLPTSAIGDAFDRLARNDVEFRFSLDVAQLTQDGT